MPKNTGESRDNSRNALCPSPTKNEHRIKPISKHLQTFPMNWYVTKIVYQIICGNGDHTPQFDEQIRLVTAENEASALQKACEIGFREEDVFRNNKQEMVQWKFIQVAELYSLPEPADGAEIYSRITETDNADAYIRGLSLRASALKERTLEACFI